MKQERKNPTPLGVAEVNSVKVYRKRSEPVYVIVIAFYLRQLWLWRTKWNI